MSRKEIRPDEVVNELEQHQQGWHSQINQLFEQRSKEQYEVMAKIRQLENEYYKMSATISEKDKEIEHLKSELRDLDSNRAAYSARDKELGSQLSQLRAKLSERENYHRSLIEELRKMDNDLKTYPERMKQFETQLSRCDKHAQELEQSLGTRYNNDSEVNRLRKQFADVKAYNQRVLADIKAREQEISRLKSQLDQNSLQHHSAQQKEEEIRQLRRRAAEIQHIYDEHKRADDEKSSEIQALEQEIKMKKTQYSNALKANHLLSKKVIVLSQNERLVGDTAQSSDSDSDDELSTLRTHLAERINSVKSLFTDGKDVPRAPANPALTQGFLDAMSSREASRYHTAPQPVRSAAPAPERSAVPAPVPVAAPTTTKAFVQPSVAAPQITASTAGKSQDVFAKATHEQRDTRRSSRSPHRRSSRSPHRHHTRSPHRSHHHDSHYHHDSRHHHHHHHQSPHHSRGERRDFF